MSTPVRIPHRATVLVADARKALLLSNEGDDALLDLKVEQVIEAPANPSTAAQGTDRPGRSIFAGRRSAVGQTDWHRAAETQFAQATVDAFFAKGKVRSLILVAPPQFLAELRRRLPAGAKAAIVAEIAKDLTHLTVDEIGKHLTGR